MDEQTFQDTVTRLRAVDAVVRDLDAGLRDEAVRILAPYITGEPADPSAHEGDEGEGGGAGKPPAGPASTKAGGDLDLDVMVEKHQSDKDHENALLALAVYYHRHGKGPLALKDIKSIADDELNVDIPSRLDKTFKTLKRDSQVVMRRAADGTWKVTPTGEKWLASEFGVAKGRTPVPDA